ncbi:hypothetical protein [Limnohabitans sp. DM1]|uniref:hypothetical protein n=1 Tax=Limnohabitans sp. DM1 TaxID=1597955 RepID=UPI000B01E6DE|nr:hypothetical protein [Limnohabitans sp. DM1]
MKNTPNYSLYHTHELKKRLAELDPKNDQDEIHEIQKMIDKGGYQFPSTSSKINHNTDHSIKRKAVATKFQSSKFILILCLTMTMLLAWNLYVLIVFGLGLALIPIVFQSVILYCLYNAHVMSKPLIKIWAALMMVSGFFGLISVVLGKLISIDQFLIHIVYLIAGFYAWTKANHTMEIIYAAHDEPN